MIEVDEGDQNAFDREEGDDMYVLDWDNVGFEGDM